MATEERIALLAKANELSLEFKGNISNKDLTELVKSAEGPAAVSEEVSEDTEAPNPEVVAKASEVVKVLGKKPLTKEQKRRNFIANRKKIAMATRVVTITNKDNRENDVSTTAPLSFENQFFGIAKNVPLDVAVELEQALIDIAEATCITQHKDEIIDGRRTGNKVPTSVKKYVVSYAK